MIILKMIESKMQKKKTNEKSKMLLKCFRTLEKWEFLDGTFSLLLSIIIKRVLNIVLEFASKQCVLDVVLGLFSSSSFFLFNLQLILNVKLFVDIWTVFFCFDFIAFDRLNFIKRRTNRYYSVVFFFLNLFYCRMQSIYCISRKKNCIVLYNV